MKNFVSKFDKELKPTDYINLMYEKTNDKYILYIPDLYCLNEPNYSLRCKIKWDYKDLEQTIFEYEESVSKINRISRIYRIAKEDVSHIKELMTNHELYPVYTKFFVPFHYSKVDEKEIEAPEQVINHEVCMLAASYVVYKYASTMEKVNDSVRINSEKLSFMTEEEEEKYLDSLYRPKKRNNRKQMLSLFVYHILAQNSNPNRHMSQQEIINELQEMPYELTIERKALGRVIHGLEEEMTGIHSDPRGGSWYDKNDDEFGLVSLD